MLFIDEATGSLYVLAEQDSIPDRVHQNHATQSDLHDVQQTGVVTAL